MHCGPKLTSTRGWAVDTHKQACDYTRNPLACFQVMPGAAAQVKHSIWTLNTLRAATVLSQI